MGLNEWAIRMCAVLITTAAVVLGSGMVALSLLQTALVAPSGPMFYIGAVLGLFILYFGSIGFTTWLNARLLVLVGLKPLAGDKPASVQSTN